jgi:hypothetical protein
MVTSIEQIRAMAVKEVEIRGFEEGQFITLQLKGIGLTSLVASGKIPNHLLGTAIELFEGKKKEDKEENEKISDTIQMIDIICESVMVEPKFEDVKEYLTDHQKMEIFTFAQGGVNALNSFREVKKINKHIEHSDSMELPTESVDEHN